MNGATGCKVEYFVRPAATDCFYLLLRTILSRTDAPFDVKEGTLDGSSKMLILGQHPQVQNRGKPAARILVSPAYSNDFECVQRPGYARMVM